MITKYQKGWTSFFFTPPLIYRKIGEELATQLSQASSTRPGEPCCFLHKQPPSEGRIWKAQVGLVAICTPLFTKYTPSALFYWFFFCNVTELYELLNDTYFLSVMSRNPMDYTIVPSLASGMLWNFTDCALTLSFDSRHAGELHGLPKDGCQVPWSGQAKVASHRTYGLQTKLGYDSCPFLLVFYWR